MTRAHPTPVPPTPIWQALRNTATSADVTMVALGGATGATARWAVVHLANSGTSFPWPTLVVNVVGCLVVGMLSTSRRSLQMLAGIGFAGGLTTFSTFAVETADLLDRSDAGMAVAYTAASVVSGLVAVVLGRSVTHPLRSGSRYGTTRC